MIESEAWKEFDFQCGGGACVIVEKTAGSVVIRDSKNPALPGLVFTKREYADFRRRVGTVDPQLWAQVRRALA